ncbi:hypothetical protein EGW08_006897, partial [Elysia chlorotica]
GGSGGSKRGLQQRDQGAVGGAESPAAADFETSAKLKLHEDLMSVLHGEILRCIRQVEVLTSGRPRETTAVRDLTGKVENLQRQLGVVDLRLDEILQGKLPISPAEVGTLVESENGTATWCIPQFSQVRREAVNSPQVYKDSPPFTTGSMGYKLKMRLFADGNGAAKGNAMSVYLHLLPGSCDDLLPWPFQADIHFVLVDQKDFKHHKCGSIRSPITADSCKQPTTEQLGFGIEALVTLREIGTDLSRYNVKDTLYLRVIVDLKQSKLPARLKSLDPRQMQYATNFRQADGAANRK